MPYHSETLLLAQKSQLFQLLLQNPSLNQVQLAEWAKRKYHLSKLPSLNTFFGILRNKWNFKLLITNHKLLLLSILVKDYLYNCIFPIIVSSIHFIQVLGFFHSNLTVDLNDMQLCRLCNNQVCI